MKNFPFAILISSRPKLTILFAALIWVVALAGLTSGCVFVPTPHYYAVGSRQNVTEQSTNLIQPSVDTIENVILKLGEPDAISPDERRVTYSSKKVIGELIVIGADTDGSDLPNVNQYRFLNIMLDDKSVVTNREFSKQQISMLTGSIGGEKINFGSRVLWFSGCDIGTAGDLLLTESALYFFEESQLLNGQPTLCLRYDSVAECRLGDGIGWSSEIIIRTRDNHSHSFDNLGSEKAKSFCEFIQSKIKTNRPEK